MSADDRRAAIIDATVPLLRVHGWSLTTRQVAEAAGVAEGTIFRVFTDKRDLIQAAVDKAFDIDPLYDAVTDIDPTLALDERLRAALRIMLDAIGDVRTLVMVMHASAESNDGAPWHGPPSAASHGPRGPKHRLRLAIEQLLAPDAEQLAHPPGLVAAMLIGAVVGVMVPGNGDDEPVLTPDAICDVILRGALKR